MTNRPLCRTGPGPIADALFIACSDSRVAVNVFASTNPGDLLVVRNVGNMIPPCGANGLSVADRSEAAAIEFALNVLHVSDIIVCGHSECGAMQALVDGRENINAPHLKAWLRHGDDSLGDLVNGPSPSSHTLAKHNHLSQINVVRQMQNLMTYPAVKELVEKGQLRIHGWWFELKQAEVFNYNHELKAFVTIDESEAKRIMAVLS